MQKNSTEAIEQSDDASIIEEQDTFAKLLQQATPICPATIKGYSFSEDFANNNAIDRFVLLNESEDIPLFQVAGNLTSCNNSISSSVMNRRPRTRIEEYSFRLELTDAKTVTDGFNSCLDLLKNTEGAVNKIAMMSGLISQSQVPNKEDSKYTMKISNLSSNILYFNRKVARPSRNNGKTSEPQNAIPSFLNIMPEQLPKGPKLIYPEGYELNPIVPVFDSDENLVVDEPLCLPRKCKIFFELKQGCYNFHGTTGPVRQIVLIPSIVAIKVEPFVTSTPVASSVKRRRLSY